MLGACFCWRALVSSLAGLYTEPSSLDLRRSTAGAAVVAVGLALASLGSAFVAGKLGRGRSFILAMPVLANLRSRGSASIWAGVKLYFCSLISLLGISTGRSSQSMRGCEAMPALISFTACTMWGLKGSPRALVMVCSSSVAWGGLAARGGRSRSPNTEPRSRSINLWSFSRSSASLSLFSCLRGSFLAFLGSTLLLDVGEPGEPPLFIAVRTLVNSGGKLRLAMAKGAPGGG